MLASNINWIVISESMESPKKLKSLPIIKKKSYEFQKVISKLRLFISQQLSILLSSNCFL